jgi:hypothetical protein
MLRRLIVVLAVVGGATLASFPPWQTMDGLPRGHAFIASPPAPMESIGSPSAGPWAPGFFGPSRIDWPMLLRGQVLIAIVAIGLMWASALSNVGVRVGVCAAMLAFLMPLPLVVPGEGVIVTPPIGLLPQAVYLESAGGVPAVIRLAVLWLMAAMLAGVVLGAAGLAVHLSRRRRRGRSAPESSE